MITMKYKCNLGWCVAIMAMIIPYGVAFATSPQVLPMVDFLRLFDDILIPACERLAKESNKFNKTGNTVEYIALMQGCLDGMVKTDLPTVRGNLLKKVPVPDAALAYAQLSNHVIEFRRIADRLAVELLASGELTVDSKYLGELRTLWAHERLFSLRFSDEVLALILHPAEPKGR